MFSSTQNIESDYENKYVLEIAQIIEGREKNIALKHFVRFENIGDKLFLCTYRPDYNVLPLIIPHFPKADMLIKIGLYMTRNVSMECITINKPEQN